MIASAGSRPLFDRKVWIDLVERFINWIERGGG